MSNITMSLADQAYMRVEEMIVTLELAPGTVFSEGALSNRIGIGRTPLREAVQRLAAEGLVTTRPRRGVVVSDITPADHLTLLETRRVLDHLMISQAAERAAPAHREELYATSQALQKRASGDSLADFIGMDRHCDELLKAASRNAYAARAVAPLHTHCRRFWYAYRHACDPATLSAFQAQIMEAVAHGDDATATSASDALLGYLVRSTRAAFELS